MRVGSLLLKEESGLLLGGWNVDIMAGTGAAILGHEVILGLKIYIEKQQD